MNKGCTPILIHLKNAHNKDASSRLENNLVGSLVKDYEDIFQAISAGLSLDIEVTHIISFREGHTPPFRLIL